MKGMTPEEWERKQAEMKRKIEQTLRDRPGYCDHIREQYEAWLREHADLRIKDHVDAVPQIERWLLRRQRIEWVKSKAMWLAAAALAAILLWALKVALN